MSAGPSSGRPSGRTGRAHRAKPQAPPVPGPVLIGAEELRHRIALLGREISTAIPSDELTIIGILNGTLLFLADLIRQLSIRTRIDCVGISSYRGDTRAGHLTYTKQLQLDVANRDVLVVDDILDTGRTLARVLKDLESFQPRSLRSCVLLSKRRRRLRSVTPDFVGFEIPDVFVVGYGLDYQEHYRNLPHVAACLPPKTANAQNGAKPRLTP